MTGVPLQAKLPSQFEVTADIQGADWYVFKVSNSLDWRAALDGAHVHLRPGAAPVFSKSKTPLFARELPDEWSQFLPLKPKKTGSEKMVVGGKVNRILDVMPFSENLRKAEEVAREARAGRAAADKRRQAGADRQRAMQESQRKVNLARFKVPSMVEALRAVGFDVPPGTDFTAEADRRPHESGNGEEVKLELQALTAEEAESGIVRLAYWGLGPFPAHGAEKLSLKCIEGSVKGKSFLLGKMANGKLQDFEGVKMRRLRSVFVVGIKAPGSKRVYLTDCEPYQMNLKRKEVSPDDVKVEEPLSYGLMKGKLIEDLGTVKKQRISKMQQAKKSREHAVAEFGDYAEELKERAEVMQSKVVSLEEQDRKEKEKMLPRFNPDAMDPLHVYREGLQDIAPEALLEAETDLADPQLVELLQRDPAQQQREIAAAEALPEDTRVQNLGPCGSRLALALAGTRARAGLKASSELAATRIAKNFGVLNCLVAIVKLGPRFRGGKCMPQGVAELCGLDSMSALAAHWHNVYYTDMLGRRKVRQHEPNKSLCALMIWALHLTPNLRCDFQPSIERELRLKPGELKTILEFIGCQVVEERKAPGADTPTSAAGKTLCAKLLGPPKYNKNFYERGSGGKKKDRR